MADGDAHLGRDVLISPVTVTKTTVKITASGPGARRHQKERPFVGLSREGRVTIK